MNIDSLRAAIRPMNTSQAVDLGFAMARHWFVPLWKLWMSMALPIYLILLMVTLFILDASNTSIFWTGAIFWWLKPLYEKPLVKWLGYALFEEPPPIKQSITDGWKQFFQFAPKLLIMYRLSLQRQLLLPILILERQSKHRQIRNRHSLLSRGQSNGLTWHTMIMIHIELILVFGTIAFIFQLIPQGYLSSDDYVTLITNQSAIQNILYQFMTLIAYSIVAPFFICGGFAVYLTKRCLLESWDIEIIFKQLAKRYQDANNQLDYLNSQHVTKQHVQHVMKHSEETT